MGKTSASERGSAPGQQSPLLNEFEVAHLTGMSIGSVRRWRILGQGPKYIKLLKAVRYKPVDVFAWIDSRPSGTMR
jgi:predicted DNA-binding transcriptional regulator AlpA